jgi:hypothetical protein
MSELKKITGYLTPSQIQAFKAAQAKYAERTGKIKQSEVLDMLIAQFCEAQGVEYPDDKNPHGYRKDYKDFSADE